MALNLAVLLSESAAWRAESVAIISDEQRITYHDLNVASNKVANALRSLGVQQGERVALLLPNVAQFPVVYYGALKLGATVVPLDPLLPAAEARACIDDAGAALVIAGEDLATETFALVSGAAHLRHLVTVNAPGSQALPAGALSYDALLAVSSSAFDLVWTMPDDVAVIQYAPRRAGERYGVELTHANLFFNATLLADRVLHASHETVGLAGLPLCSPFGQSGALNALIYAGASLVLTATADSQTVMQDGSRHHATYLACTAETIAELLAEDWPRPAINAGLETCACLGAPLAAAEHSAFEDTFGVRLLEGYGLPEASPVVTMNTPGARRAGSLGRALWGVQAAILDSDGRRVPTGRSGEVCVRGHNVMKGYHGRPDATARRLRDGWLHTGDVGVMDSDGYLSLAETA